MLDDGPPHARTYAAGRDSEAEEPLFGLPVEVQRRIIGHEGARVGHLRHVVEVEGRAVDGGAPILATDAVALHPGRREVRAVLQEARLDERAFEDVLACAEFRAGRGVENQFALNHPGVFVRP